jgi:hypothetical protein
MTAISVAGSVSALSSANARTGMPASLWTAPAGTRIGDLLEQGVAHAVEARVL